MCCINFIVIREGETFRKSEKGDMTSRNEGKEREEHKHASVNSLFWQNCKVHYFQKRKEYLEMLPSPEIKRSFNSLLESIIYGFLSSSCNYSVNYILHVSQGHLILPVLYIHIMYLICVLKTEKIRVPIHVYCKHCIICVL